MITAAILGTGLVAAGAAGTAAAGAAGAYWYKRKQKRKAKKKKALKEGCIFGQHLEEVTRLSVNELPEVFDCTLCWLQTNCLGVEDLFGSRNPMRAGELARQFDETLDEDELPDFSAEDPHDVALLLVRYLTDLPEPLCTFVMYDDFVRCEEESNVENWVEAMRNQLLQLPDINLRVIKRLIRFLGLYATEQQLIYQIPRDRTIDSLGSVFGFLTFRSYDEEQGNANFEDKSISQSLLSKCIVNRDALFGSIKENASTLSPAVAKALSPVGTVNAGSGICLDKAPLDNTSTSSISLAKVDPPSSGICLDKPPLDSPTKKSRKSRKDKKKHKKKQDEDIQDACVMELDLDENTLSGPELTVMCDEVRSQVATIDLNKTDKHASYRKKDGNLKPLPPPPRT